MTGVEAGLRRVASAARLLVVSDFDGTLAPIVDHPDAVLPDRAAVTALRALAVLPDTHAAVLSGRALAVLREHLDGTDLVLIGSHGAETDLPAEPPGEPTSADAAGRGVLAEIAERLDALAGEYRGALVERKPTAVAFHYRRVVSARQDEAAARATELAEVADVLRVQPGHMVVELVAGTANKGDALDALRRSVDATATVFVGDDRTDEHAFGRLGPSDLGIKVGPGVTAATVRVAAQSDVAALFRRLLALRRR